MKQTKDNTLHLFLKEQWYDMIKSGRKTEEYREIKPYWLVRFLDLDYTAFSVVFKPRKVGMKVIPQKFRFVVFHRGYTDTTITMKVRYVAVGKGRTDWGAPKGREVFIIGIGERVIPRFTESALFESNTHLKQLPSVHDTEKTKVINGKTKK